jgi:hypothetical protein
MLKPFEMFHGKAKDSFQQSTSDIYDSQERANKQTSTAGCAVARTHLCAA